jgi:putative transposase
MESHLDARYERVREEGVIRSQAVLLAIGINWDGPLHTRRAHLLGQLDRSPSRR